jgi:hypothetical protein
MTEKLFSLLQTWLSRDLPLVLDNLLAGPEAYGPVPFPSRIWITAMVCKTPHRMHSANFRSAIQALSSRCRTYWVLVKKLNETQEEGS